MYASFSFSIENIVLLCPFHNAQSLQENNARSAANQSTLTIVAIQYNKQLLDEVEHDIMNYQNRGLCYDR